MLRTVRLHNEMIAAATWMSRARHIAIVTVSLLGPMVACADASPTQQDVLQALSLILKCPIKPEVAQDKASSTGPIVRSLFTWKFDLSVKGETVTISSTMNSYGERSCLGKKCSGEVNSPSYITEVFNLNNVKAVSKSVRTPLSSRHHYDVILTCKSGKCVKETTKYCPDGECMPLYVSHINKANFEVCDGPSQDDAISALKMMLK